MTDRRSRTRSKLWHALESLESRRLMSGYLSFSGIQTITPGPTIDVSNDNAFGQSGMAIDVNPTNPLCLAGIALHVGGQNEIDVYRSNDGGTTWSKTAIDNGAAGIADGTAAGTRFDPSIAYDGNGTLFVAYCNDTGTSTSIVVGRSADNGATFNQFRTIATATDIYNGTAAEVHGNEQVSLATGPDGVGGQALYVTYVNSAIEGSAGLDDRIMLNASNNGGSTFLGATVVNNASITGASSGNLSPDVAVGPTGQTYVVWHSVNIDTGVERLLFDKDLDGRFAGASNFGTDSVAKSFPNGSLVGWWIPGQPDRGVYTAPTLAVDRSGGPFNGRVYLGYCDDTNPGDAWDIDVHVAHYDGAGWTDSGADASFGAQFDPQVTVDQNSGAVAVGCYSSFSDRLSGNDDVRPELSMSIDGGATWSINAVSLQSSNELGGYSGDYGDHIGLAFRDGTAHVCWSSRHGVGTDLDAFTTTVGFVSATGGNVAYAQTPYPGSQYIGYTRITRFGDYLLVAQGPSSTSPREAFLAATVNQAVINAAAATDNDFVVDSPPGGIPLTVNGGDSRDVLYLVSVPANTPVTFNGNSGDDYASVSTNDKSLDPIQGAFTFNGGAGADSLEVYDEEATAGALFTITSTSVTRAGFGGASYDANVEYIDLFAGHGDDQVNVMSSRALSTVTVFLNDGDDAIYLGGGNVAPIQGWLRVDGGNGAADALVMVDNGTAGSDNYMINGTDIGRGSVARATYTTFEEVYLLAERGNNTINVSGTMIGCSYHVNGYDGSDTYNIQETNSAAPVVIDPSNGDDAVNVNSDNTGTAKVVFPYSERIGALTVGNGGIAQLASADPGYRNVLTVTSLSFGTGQLDLRDGDLIVDYTGPSPFASIRDDLTSGYFASGWTGAGIMSSVAAADAQHQMGLGYAEAAQLGYTRFDDHNVDSTAILVKYTYYGDANLDGGVDTVDFNFLAANFGGSGKSWTQGDYNFDTVTDTVDFNLLAACFSKTLIAATNSLLKTPASSESLAADCLE